MKAKTERLEKTFVSDYFASFMALKPKREVSMP